MPLTYEESKDMINIYKNLPIEEKKQLPFLYLCDVGPDPLPEESFLYMVKENLD